MDVCKACGGKMMNLEAVLNEYDDIIHWIPVPCDTCSGTGIRKVSLHG